MKEAIFHPEARAEMRESIDFYEVRLEGLGLRFLAAVEETTQRIVAYPEAGAPLAGEFRTMCGRIISTSLLWLTIIVGRAIGANEPVVANHRLKNDARRAYAS